MVSAITVLALLIFLLHAYVFIDTLLGLSRMQWLREVSSGSAGEKPRVSIIVPACNEEATIGPALRTLLDQDYPNLQILVVDDRSTDGTGRAVAGLQELNGSRLQLLRIDHLPPGWLGKSHALFRGAEQTDGDILLFTDADIRMERSSVSRAVSVMEQQQLDHLTLIFQPLGGNWLLNAMMLDAASGLMAMLKPWKAAGKNRFFIGVGAFNMVRRSCYTGIGGHRAIPLHPLDDLMLGKLVKTGGYRQNCLLGHGMITVYWYESVRGMISGLMKNVFSVFHYRLWQAALAILFLIITTILPMAAMFTAGGAASLLFGAAVLLRFAGLGIGARICAMHPGTLAGAAATPFLSIYIIARAALTTVIGGGITWRGTRYPLEKLRRSPPLLF